MKFSVLLCFIFLAANIVSAQNKLQCVIDVEQAKAAAKKSKDYSQALVKADDCVRKNPKSVDALFARAGLHAVKPDFDLAIADANAAVGRDPRNADMYHRRGLVYEQKARNTFLKDEAAGKALRKEASEAAYADFDKALELDSKKGESILAKTTLRRYFMGTGFLSLLSQYNRAIELLTAAKNTNVLAQAYYERGNVYSLEQQNDLAIADFTTAIKIKPDYLDAYALRGGVHSSPFFNPKRNVDAAIADYTKVIEIEASAYWYTSRAALYEEKGEREKAIADYRAALVLEPNNYTAKTHLAKLAPAPLPVKSPTPQPPQPNADQFAAEGRRQLSQKDYDGAIKSLSECLRLKPDAGACLAFRGYAYGMKGNMSAANSDHEVAVKLTPNEPAIYFVRGMMLKELGNKAGAIAQFRNVLKLDPNNSQAKAALKDLGVEPN